MIDSGAGFAPGEADVRSYEMKLCTFIAATTVLTMIGCAPFTHAPTTRIPSPSGKYLLGTTINRETSDKTTYLCVRLILTRPTGETVTERQTHASNVHKWAVGWMTNEEVVVLDSSDVGIYAYRVTKDETLSEIAFTNITPEIETRAAWLKKDKYK